MSDLEFSCFNFLRGGYGPIGIDDEIKVLERNWVLLLE